MRTGRETPETGADGGPAAAACSGGVAHDATVCQVETQMAVLARSLEQLQRRGDVSQGFDRSGYLLCRTLDAQGDATINQLAGHLGLDATTVTRQVAALEDKGVVTRRTDPDDRRSSIIALTADGHRLMCDAQSRRRDRTADLLDGFTAREQRDLGALLAKLNAAIQDRHLV